MEIDLFSHLADYGIQQWVVVILGAVCISAGLVAGIPIINDDVKGIATSLAFTAAGATLILTNA